MVHVFRIFILTAIVAFLPTLALPVDLDSQDLVAREPNSILDWFRTLGRKFKSTFSALGRKFRNGTLPGPLGAVSRIIRKPRELEVVYAREDSDELYIRELDNDVYAREMDDEFEARDVIYDDEFEAREFEDDFVGRELGEEIDARGPSSLAVDRQRRELFYDRLD
jgi:hypothetical protein